MTDKELFKTAIEAMSLSYSPYSNFKVGAALLARSGKVYVGANIENSAYTPTVCAERTAFFKAITEGEREFKAIAVAGGKNGKISGEVTPCGVCRQVMAEFCAPDFIIITVNEKDEYKKYTLCDLLPKSFNIED